MPHRIAKAKGGSGGAFCDQSVQAHKCAAADEEDVLRVQLRNTELWSRKLFYDVTFRAQVVFSVSCLQPRNRGLLVSNAFS